ncbi:MAG TPA: glutamate--tRNA ligase [Nitrososphaerales archaeon]|nr:glutamate--tRNA ligase [Nitrososphaerales archaeon]
MSESESRIRSSLRLFALLNSVSHRGKPDAGAVIGRVMAERPDLRGQSTIIRKLLDEVVREVQSLSLDQQAEILRTQYPGALEGESNRRREISKRDSKRVISLPPLPGAIEGLVSTRFPPEPNGYMHIGHAKAAFIGSEYAKLYGGKFIVRFDDTNPAAEKLEYYGAFLDALSWLDVKPDLVKNASDDINIFYHLAEKMISDSKAYVCTCAKETMKLMRGEGRACVHRTQEVNKNLALWSAMKDSTVEKGEAVLRFVGDMTSPNTAMRDPVLFRIVEEPHPIQGKKYRVWPTYDFDGPVEDSLDGVTHAMRSKEYELRDELYNSILNAMGLRQPRIIEFSRLALQNTTVSKRSLRRLIEEGKVEGWDDPRLPTISGLRRRGFLPESIKEFILSMGLSKVESEPSWDLLESFNRKNLDPFARRYFFVPNPVKLTVRGAPKIEVSLKFHPEKDFGSRSIRTDGKFLIPRLDVNDMKEKDSFRLIEAYNVQIEEKRSDEIVGVYKQETSLAPLAKVQWTSLEESEPLSVKIPGPLLLDGEFNPKSLNVLSGVGERSTEEIQIGTVVQFVRFGFCRMDEKGMAILAHR